MTDWTDLVDKKKLIRHILKVIDKHINDRADYSDELFEIKRELLGSIDVEHSFFMQDSVKQPPIEPEAPMIENDSVRSLTDEETEVFEEWLNHDATIESELRHGQWIEIPPYEDETVKGLEFQIVCSRCGEQNSSITFDENSVPIEKTFYRTRYCPNCGARMGVEEVK